MNAIRRHTRLLPIALVVLLASLLALLQAPTANAKSCAAEIIDDWWDNARLDKFYPLKCYQQAIDSLPVDVVEYTEADEDILRAFQARKRNVPDPGRPGSGTGTTPTDPTPTGPDGKPIPPTDEEPTDTETLGGPGDVDTSGPSSIPVPLLVLGGLSLLLLAAGGAGYLSRRTRTDDLDA